ncbi:hypothetical protein WBG78_04425 [Chryseolinea sp. T2]|uniref:hypothetical protein n=1 Tax=Chryseolinea sp. T2 TaxID=3129255 RepID=UPI00307776AF
MAELEVVKHTKKIHNILKNEELSWWHKVKEFLIEIVIIVFAVTITIWFHDLSEKRHKQHDVSEFLAGLKTDLQRDIVELEADRKGYTRMKKAFAYINGVAFHEKPLADSLKFYYNWYFNEVGFVPNDGRFEGFKSSGKVGDIEDKELQNDIMDLYQEDIRALVSSTAFFSERKGKLVDYLTKNMKQESESTYNLSTIMATDEARNICRTLYFTDEIIGRYDTCIVKSKRIIDAIDKAQH